jgi:hypothetical protein
VRKLDPHNDPSIFDKVVLGSVVKAVDENAKDKDLADKAIVTLVNIEEDRISRTPLNYTRVYDKVVYKNPKVFLNLYLLFAVNHTKYDSALQYLSLIIQFFQHKNILNHQNSPSASEPKLHPTIEQLVFDMVTMNFEQVNHLWATLGGKYLPSVLYKVRLVTIEEETPQMEGSPIMDITITEEQITPH